MALNLVLLAVITASRGVPVTDPGPQQSDATPTNDTIKCISGNVWDLQDGIRVVYYRTTAQIVWACLATIFTCAWIAIHPNIPGPRDSGFHRLRRRIIFAILEIITPGLIFLLAARQRIAAGGIKRKFNRRFSGGGENVTNYKKLCSNANPPSDDPARLGKKWTVTHGFFVQMGGLMMTHEGKPVQVLTFDRLLKAIGRGEIDVPHIPENEITDKSKGDGLSKLVVTLQTTWFIAQCIGRRCSKLPLAELEVLTLAYAVLNIIIYILWWSKPQGVLLPITLEFKAPPMPPSPPASENDATNRGFQINAASSSSSSKEGQPVIEQELDKRNFNTIRLGFNRLIRDGFAAFLLFPFTVWFNAAGYLLRVGEKTAVNADSESPASDPGVRFKVGKSRVPMFYVEDDHCQAYSRVVIGSFFFISTMFGGLHLIQYSASFTTPLGSLFWKGSAVFITVAPPFVWTLNIFSQSTSKSDYSDSIKWLVKVCSYFSLLLYLAARGLLIFVSVYGVIHLPICVHIDFQWSDVIPHI